MKTFLSIVLLAVVAALAFISCNSNKEEEPKCLVLYYSQTGNTKQVAEEISQKLSAVVEEIQLEEPYDGDYDQTIERSRAEIEDSIIPKIKPIEANLEDYDIVFIGYPVWFGSYALPIAGLIQDYGDKLAQKKIVPFCTFGSGGLESSVNNLKEALPDAQISDGYGIRAARLETAMPKEVEIFLVNEGFVPGTIEELPDFSDQEPVTEEDVAIFEGACAAYPMPLGTPITVGKRSFPDGTDYKFTSKAKLGDEDADITIYIRVGNDEGATPEFIKAVR